MEPCSIQSVAEWSESDALYGTLRHPSSQFSTSANSRSEGETLCRMVTDTLLHDPSRPLQGNLHGSFASFIRQFPLPLEPHPDELHESLSRYHSTTSSNAEASTAFVSHSGYATLEWLQEEIPMFDPEVNKGKLQTEAGIKASKKSSDAREKMLEAASSAHLPWDGSGYQDTYLGTQTTVRVPVRRKRLHRLVTVQCEPPPSSISKP